MEDVVADSVAQPRFQMRVMMLLAATALFLAGLGIYAVVAQGVIQRRAEFGLRLALGSTPRDVVALVVRRAMAPVAIGLAAGVVASAGVARLLRAVLFGVTASDPAPLAIAALFLTGVALAAAVIPALRATRIDPRETLRAEI